LPAKSHAFEYCDSRALAGGRKSAPSRCERRPVANGFSSSFRAHEGNAEVSSRAESKFRDEWVPQYVLAAVKE